MSDERIIDTTDFDHLPGGAFFQLYVPMICPHCSDIHHIAFPTNAIPQEGLSKLIQIMQERLIVQGYRVPTEEEFEEAIARGKARQKEQEEFLERIKAQGGTPYFVNRTPREGGDA